MSVSNSLPSPQKSRLSIDTLVESSLVPDWLIRIGIRRLLKQRISQLKSEFPTENADVYQQKLGDFVDKLKRSPLAVHTDLSTGQHYEVPTAFYDYSLGKRKKYSCCWYETGRETLDEAEIKMLDKYLERADIQNGQKVLDLGCGWGSFGLYCAEKFPGASVTCLSHSKTQREYILSQAKERGINNLDVITKDFIEFETTETYDRIVSIEMFEHLRNYKILFDRLHSYLNPGGKVFFHVFVHKNAPYLFENVDDSDWMTRYFFAGGTMPSENLFEAFEPELKLENKWAVNGTHYGKTARHWLENMDNHKTEIEAIFREFYGVKEMKKWWNYWRIFFMACEELWNYDKGREWFVSHYLFTKKS